MTLELGATAGDENVNILLVGTKTSNCNNVKTHFKLAGGEKSRLHHYHFSHDPV